MASTKQNLMARIQVALKTYWHRFTSLSLFFMGLGVYRAWIELVYVRPTVDYPAFQVAGNTSFDIAMVVVLLLCAASYKKLTPLIPKKPFLWLCFALMTFGSILIVISVATQAASAPFAFSAAIISGAGTALMILFWSELYSCMNPINVALYYCGSLIVGALVIFICNGFFLEYHLGAIVVLPALSLLALTRGFKEIPIQHRPHKSIERVGFPWKPALLMAIYAFAFGLHQIQMAPMFGPHSSWATVMVAAGIFLGVLVRNDRFNFSHIYRFALPALVIGFLVLPLLLPGTILGDGVSWNATFWGDTFVTMSFTSFTIFIMLILSNISYRMGVSAVMLFGISRAVQTIFQVLGRQTSVILDDALPLGTADLTVSVTVVILVVIATASLISERDLYAHWGVTLFEQHELTATPPEKVSADDDPAHLITLRCNQFSRSYQLSARESEILLLTAQGLTMPAIAEQLYIAVGTVKAHTRHIYRKAGIHSRHELFEMLGIDDTAGVGVDVTGADIDA